MDEPSLPNDSLGAQRLIEASREGSKGCHRGDRKRLRRLYDALEAKA
jgi:hypothetical protein